MGDPITKGADLPPLYPWVPQPQFIGQTGHLLANHHKFKKYRMPEFAVLVEQPLRLGFVQQNQQLFSRR